MELGILLSKLLPLLVYPFSLGLLLVLFSGFAVVFGWRRAGLVAVVLAVAVLSVAGSPRTAAALIAALERNYPPVPVSASPRADAIVVLGGGLGLPLPPRLDAELNGSSDRVLHAARLYRAGKATAVIISGGNVFPQHKVKSEAFYTARLLAEWGVPAGAIVIESESRNTRENAVYTQRILEQNGWHRVLLVTSAAHMPRALAAFRTAGVDAIASPTDFVVVGYQQPGILDWFPNAGALDATTFALKEYLGTAVYRWRGWIQD